MARPLNAVAAASGPLLYAALQALTLLIIARLGGVEDAADFFLAQAIATPLGQFVSLRLKEQLATEAHQTKFVDRINRVCKVAVAVGVLGSLGWVIFAERGRALVGIGILLANLAQAVVAAFQGRRARRKEFFWASQSDTMLGILSLASVSIGYVGAGLELGALLMAASWWIVAIVLTLAEARQDRDRTDLISGHSIPLRHDLLLGLARAAEVGQISITRIGTSAFAGADALARIGTGSFFVRMGAPIVGGLRSAMGADLGEAAREKEIGPLLLRVRKQLLGLALVGSGLGAILGWFVIPPVIAVIYGEPVTPAPGTGAFLMGGAAFLYTSMLMGQATIAKGERGAVLRANLGAVATSALLVAPLSLWFGETGAAAALAAGYVARFVALFAIMGRRSPSSDTLGRPKSPGGTDGHGVTL